MVNNKKKDVLILCQFFYPEYVSSATLPYEMAKGFVKDGLTVDVLCGYPKEYTQEQNIPLKETVDGINIHRVKYVQLNSKKAITRLINFFSLLIAMFFKLIKLRNYKNVIVYSNPPLLPIIPVIAKFLFKFNLIFVAYDIYPEVAIKLGATNQGSLIDKITTKINALLYKKCSKVVALSDEMKKYLVNQKPHLTDDKVEVIPNWYTDKNELTDNTIHNEEFKKLKNSGKTIILYSGNMGMAQDMETIMRAIKGLQNNQQVHFLMVGHGRKLNALKAEAKESGLKNVDFYEFLHGTDFTDVLKIADGYIISLEKGLEGLCVPSKTYSYMAVGRPLFVIMNKETDIAKDVVKNNLGFVIEQGEVQGMISGIESLAKDNNTAQEMGERCRNVYLNNYTSEICIQKYIEMLKKIS